MFAIASTDPSVTATAPCIPLGAIAGETTHPIESPWGQVQSQRQLAPGIVSVITQGHGGIHLDPWRQECMPAALRQDSGWYEEDSEWCKPVVIFEREMPTELVVDAYATLKGAFPAEYEVMSALGWLTPSRRQPG